MTNVDEYLEHYGKLGMHWGVRTTSDGTKVRTSAESKRVSELKKRPKTSLTNKQLKTVNERLTLEQRFSQLNPSRVRRGRRMAEEIVASVGVATALYKIANSDLGKKAIEKGIKFLKK